MNKLRLSGWSDYFRLSEWLNGIIHVFKRRREVVSVREGGVKIESEVK